MPQPAALFLPPGEKSGLVKTGGRLIKHARYYWLLLAEGHLNRRLFGSMLRRIWALPLPSGLPWVNWYISGISDLDIRLTQDTRPAPRNGRNFCPTAVAGGAKRTSNPSLYVKFAWPGTHMVSARILEENHENQRLFEDSGYSLDFDVGIRSMPS